MNLDKKMHNWLDSYASMARKMGRTWQIVKSREIDIKTKRKLFKNSDKVSEVSEVSESKPEKMEVSDNEIIDDEIPEEILELKKERDVARAEKNWQEYDELRCEIERGGYILEDKDGKSIIRKNLSSLI
ncbi:MAG: hypothetical protein A3A96_00035 [Candidatus Zambryskibacteria bacterium RIFCSPLOWO2_01_FULL_39_39]|uniref:Cysteinyl-tRNA ligase anticodon binding domain-containing protein n=1 Tax=Candidatus Zambryskibacteria bacterium RIFCSPLOWO2_01_FULL_39_39 TaxID=1802758 RepID=A0A1G2TWZ8_9BACT|nr:MAG: Cysteine-tRNA ligase [Parcubacteria group bacterium GW2011_GWA1_38_7]OHA87486.1 MAG: hypothetical protein A2644_02910 [Candidatus Zambryskibacteria bacterium RIFCSPHIGHO2_01_FULL_39_63]OHA94876.1 MAG: hypothetical protein A3B88_00660 [Candidatus Zambryskibacteria bacterium RIFCSPHIGHO2_02_FULL_39_19]OHA99056.1 MAG: hypothetical protein A3F20_02610 [Candidatus Zambryskibacteria bacterium RIFCSPHIGHO2_12_FULL_39_21]OHB01817.1 MAG: hypothetical protein A3A96_00035 [Candidatus Zambryskibact